MKIDLMGKNLLGGRLDKSENANIDVSSLMQGLYHISISSDKDKVEVIRFIIQ